MSGTGRRGKLTVLYRQTSGPLAYFASLFGFPAIGGWGLVHMGKGALIALIAACGLAAFVLAMMRDEREVGSLSKA
jgi:hypothetical protein